MSNLKDTFTHGKALIAFITCGDPDLETTARAIRAAVENGADVIELGIPFSDPTAESAIVQAANTRALLGGVTIDNLFAFVRDLRQTVSVPLVFVTYANVVFSYGTERFLATCAEIGIEGLRLLDVPLEETPEFAPLCEHYAIDLIAAIAPSSGERIARIVRNAKGFLCLHAGFGGADLAEPLRLIRAHTDLPCVIDSDLATPEQAHRMAALADGVMVGSALVSILANDRHNAPERIGAFVRTLKAAL